MFVRMLVHQFVRQFAQKKIQDELRSRVGPVSADSADPAEDVEDAENAEQAPAVPPAVEIAVFFALGIEANELIELLDDRTTVRRPAYLEHTGMLNNRRVLIGESGVGSTAAARAVDQLLSVHSPDWIVSAGFAGALDESMRRGQILMPDAVVDVDGNQLDVGFRIDPEVVQATRGLRVGRLLTVDQLIRTPDEKKALGLRHQALGCDMETYAVAESCQRHHVRFMAVRVISDAVDDWLSPDVEKLMNQSSLAGKLGAAAGAIFQRPAVVKDMWQLKEDALKASTRLARFLQGVLAQLQ